MGPEEKAHLVIDKKLLATGCVLQDMSEFDPLASLGVITREYLTNSGEVDYLIFIEGNPVGVIEVKKSVSGVNLTAVAEQSKLYAESGLKYFKEQSTIRLNFWATGSNKQLDFVQRINTLLKNNGTAAIVVPDNALFESGAGETVRQKLLETTELHTILRLPTEIFYKLGVKANVIFFPQKPQGPKVQTKEVWIYDLRTNMHFTPKKNPMQESDLNDFIACYNPAKRFDRRETWSESNPDGHWRKYTYEGIVARDKTSLNIFWIKDKTLTDLDNLPEPDVLA